MTYSTPPTDFDTRVRLFVYEEFLKSGYPPNADRAAIALNSTADQVRAAYERLHKSHMLVLQDESREILMASPLSAVPTAFAVEISDRRYWGNCIWDALGIIAMLKENGKVLTFCACCNEAMTLVVEDGALVEPKGVIHFAVPARRWWDDIRFT